MLHILMNARVCVCVCVSTITIVPYKHRKQSNNTNQEREQRRFVYRPIEVIWNKSKDNKNSNTFQKTLSQTQSPEHMQLLSSDR